MSQNSRGEIFVLNGKWKIIYEANLNANWDKNEEKYEIKKYFFGRFCGVRSMKNKQTNDTWGKWSMRFEIVDVGGEYLWVLEGLGCKYEFL